MTILAQLYASAPADEILIGTLEINVPGKTAIRVCNDFEEHVLGGELYEAGPLEIALPARDTSGQQTLRFGIADVTGQVQEYIEAALASSTPSTATYREFLLSDPSTPANKPVVMTIVGGQLQGLEAVFECSYYDLLNASWPRQHYTTENAPGLRYIA